MSTPTRLSRNPLDMDIRLQKAFTAAEKEFEQLNPTVNVILVETFRPQAVQNAYYAQGRSPLTEVNRLRNIAGLLPITDSQNKIITKVTTSKHSSYPSKAFDIAFIVNKVTDYKNIKRFEEFAKLIRKFDPTITWGGDWDSDGTTSDERFVDLPHFEVK